MSRRRPLLRTIAAACLLALAAPAAVAEEADCDCPKDIGEVFSSPKELRAQAQVALAQNRPDLAYRYLSLLRLLHPQSSETRDAYPMACGLFKPIWRVQRLADPSSNWATSEPVFMFAWLASFFAGDEFPQKRAEDLLLGMPPSFLHAFRAFAKRPNGSPELARWELSYEEDNGLLERVEARLAAPAPPVAGKPAPPGSGS